MYADLCDFFGAIYVFFLGQDHEHAFTKVVVELRKR